MSLLPIMKINCIFLSRSPLHFLLTSSSLSFIFCFLFFCLFLFNKFSRNLPHCRYGRVQSVKIIISPGTTTVPSSQPSPTGTITSTTELSANVASAQQHSSSDHHLSSTHPSGINKCSSQHQQQPTVVPSTVVGSTHVLEPSIGVNSCSNVSNNNVTSSNCITMCAATIAFMDIKSASKAHLAEHKFDDRILTTEYYEPSVMHHGSLESGSSLVLNSKMSSDGPANNAVGDMKETLTHGRFASTSSHGLVWISV